MASRSSEKRVREILSQAGIEIGGGDPWDIHVLDDRFYRRVLAQGSLGLGESYMDGWWECDRLDRFIHRLLGAGIENNINLPLIWEYLKAKIFNLQKRSRAYEIGERHYNAGNDLFRAMLDGGMNYSCGYWKEASTLDGAQEAKLELICRKIGLEAGQRVLDIGCGWGGFAVYAAKKRGARVVGITVSGKQVKLARELAAGLEVEIRLQDYRSLDGSFDHIVSVGMIEHVGCKNYRRFMHTVRRCLADDGLFLLQTIGSNRSGISTDPWISKYIFPNSMLPSIAQLAHAAEGLLVFEDLHNFGADYDRTLMAWHGNFERNWEGIKSNYDDRFYRMWKYYLLSCAGAFRARRIQLWQIVLSGNGVPGGYRAVR